MNPKLFEISTEFWREECQAIRRYFEENVNENLPSEISDELNALEQRLSSAV